MSDLYTSPDLDTLTPSTRLETILENLLQRLEVLEQCTGVLVQAAQAQVDGQPEQQRLLLDLQQQLITTHQLAASLGDRPPSSPPITHEPLTPLLLQLQTTMERQALGSKVLAAGAIAGLALLVFYVAGWLHPMLTNTQGMLARQQKMQQQLLVCSLTPNAQRCGTLRQAIARSERSQ